MLGWKMVGAALGVVVDDATGDHGAEPLAHVTFVEPGGLGDLITGRRCLPAERVEKARLVTDACHENQEPIVQHARHSSGERFRLCDVQLAHPRDLLSV